MALYAIRYCCFGAGRDDCSMAAARGSGGQWRMWAGVGSWGAGEPRSWGEARSAGGGGGGWRLVCFASYVGR